MEKTNYPDPKEFWADKKVCVTGGDGFLGFICPESSGREGSQGCFYSFD